MDCLFLRESDFRKSLALMTKSGGIGKKAADQAWIIVGKARAGRADELGKLTRHGESRIPHCIKYDLSGGHRLVTVQHDETIFFLTVGKHDDCDRWIEANKGFRAVIDKKTKRLSVMREVGLQHERPLPPQPPTGRRLVPPDIVEQIRNAGFPSNTVRAIEALDDTATDDDVLKIVMALPERERSNALIDIVEDLRNGRDESARAQLAVLRGDAVRADESPALLRDALSAAINSDQFVKLADLPDTEFSRLVNSGNLEDWLLFLHPDQRRVADGHFSGPVVLGGVSGSGKTTVVLHRAKHLARLLAGSRIGVFVLNDALAELLAHLKDRLCPPNLAQRIDVLSLRTFLVGRCTGNHAIADPLVLDEIWQETFESSAEDLEPVIRALSSRNLDAARYIRDELRWLHSGFARQPSQGMLTRADYLVPSKVAREGRAVPFSMDWRMRIIRCLAAYERALESRRLWDPEALGMLASEGQTTATYRAVLVDEYQDLGVLELRALLHAVVDAPDAIFLAGDARQQVFPKRLNLSEAGISSPIRRRFQKNYRNTKEILDCAWEMLQASASGEEGIGLDEADRLKPELSARHGSLPVVVRVEGPDEERAFVAACVKEHRATSDAPVCICICGVRDDEAEYLQGTVEAYRQLGLETRLLSGDATPESGVTFLSSLETVKGFEFPLVLITQCGAQQIPSPGLPTEEAWRDARRLYVAMTRARDELVISYSGDKSSFVDNFGDKAMLTSVEDFLGYTPVSAIIEPPSKGTEIPSRSTIASPGPSAQTKAVDFPLSDVATSRPNQPPSPPISPRTEVIEPQRIPDLVPVAQALRECGLEVIDKRLMGGALWVVGGPELGEFMRKLNKIGFAFVFKAGGGRASGRRSAWWTTRTPSMLPNPRQVN
jgi:hypothetical protein